MNVSAIFVAAGMSRRFGGPVPKQLVHVDGRPLLHVTLERFAAIAEIRERIVVVRAEDLAGLDDSDRASLEALGVDKIVVGGERRQDSVRAGLRACDPSCDLVLVHDAVRPMVGKDVVRAVIRAAAENSAALVAVRVRDTLKLADATGRVASTTDRSQLWRAQTPQVFARAILEKAFVEADRRGLVVTDDAEMVEAIGVMPVLVPGAESNLKVTEPEDLTIIDALLRRERREEG
ncbi:MAG: 2-C-methyl-D-erythritol 4-phosphate cytidylyltransferase [Planctomycetes bacterium]|nr:2-C-methyl-D-erythritol 4-phosphate cytidylyltransferase [Planctomycetota bacterium]MBI3843104.1 2-C-methyl-D-erythritol 4-phosphate cytidylyltransferase [Planctomycetota bacterium]